MNLEPLLERVQADIVADNPASYYASNYRAEERGYWGRLPGWIAEAPKGCRVLDVGAAYGTLALFTRRLLDAEVICLDAISDYYPPSLFESEGIRHVVRDIEREEIADLGRFDLIIFSEVIEHLNFQPTPTLRKLREALVEGGTILISTPDADSGWGKTTKYYPSLGSLPEVNPDSARIDDHVWQFTRRELEDTIREAGLRTRDVAFSAGKNAALTHLNARAVRSERRPFDIRGLLSRWFGRAR